MITITAWYLHYLSVVKCPHEHLARALLSEDFEVDVGGVVDVGEVVVRDYLPQNISDLSIVR